MSNYPRITPGKLIPHVLMAFESDCAIYLHGRAGIGKSACSVEVANNKAVIKAAWDKWAKETKNEPKYAPLKVAHFTLPQLEAEDFTGVPCHITINGAKATQFAPIEIFHSTEPFVLFLDEVSAAESRTMKVLLQLIQERTIAGVKLTPGVLIILAGNISGDRAALKSVPFTLGNRCRHHTFENNHLDWLKWAEEHSVPIEFLAWVRWKQDAGIHRYSEDDPSLAQLTPRTLTMAAANFAAGLKLGFEERDIEDAILSCVGVGSGTELITFVKLRHTLASWEQIVAGPKTAKLPAAGRFDHIYFATSMLISHLKGDLTDKAAESAAIYCGRMLEECQGCTDAMAWLVNEVCTLAHCGGKRLDKKSLQVQQILKSFEAIPALSEKILKFYELASNN